MRKALAAQAYGEWIGAASAFRCRKGLHLVELSRRGLDVGGSRRGSIHLGIPRLKEASAFRITRDG
jgi:hypothetical protein